MTIFIYLIEASAGKNSRRAYFILNKENEEINQILGGNKRILSELPYDVELLIGLNE